MHKQTWINIINVVHLKLKRKQNPSIKSFPCKVPYGRLPEDYMRPIVNRVLREGAISPEEIAANKKAVRTEFGPPRAKGVRLVAINVHANLVYYDFLLYKH